MPSRNIILCFDGTGNKFGEEVTTNLYLTNVTPSNILQNSNVVRFFRALVKDKPDEQIVYYQPGVGTYNKRQFLTRTVSSVSSAIDKGIALHLNDHVKEGYQFIMKNYQRGDKICLFGFSRGAHTARVVAGMLYKVGLLPAHNDQQVDFAFSVYQTTGSHGIELSREFKKTFAIPVTVEFLGVWDTVSSVGIIPRSHPYTSVNYAVKTFRHALALDERRARFRPQTWNEPTVEREQDLDVDDPLSIINPRGDISRDEWEYVPAARTTTDVKEVWFAGAHADVGGGSHANSINESLSFIPLRWMIKECLLAGTGILFDQRALSLFGFDFKELERALDQELAAHGLSLTSFGFDAHPQTFNLSNNPHADTSAQTAEVPPSEQSVIPLNGSWFSVPSNIVNHLYQQTVHDYSLLNLVVRHAKDVKDSVADIWDQLHLQKAWWILEILPMLTTYQRPDGTWVKQRMRNFGQGRYIPFTRNGRVLVHKSVEERMNSSTYRPAAFNWKAVVDSGMLYYVS